MNKCLGCGANLQKDFENKEGFTLDLNNNFCKRCFDIKHYNKYLKTKEKDYTKILNKIDKNDLVLLVTDFLNLYNLDEINLNAPVLLVITKADIIPNNIKEEKLLNNVKCKLNIVDKILISSKNNYNLDLLYSKILKHKKSKNVYVIGYTNAGKSTLVNKIVKNYGNKQDNITVSNLPSTTLDLIFTKVNENLTLIDTPGFLDKGSIILKAPKETLNKITPKNKINPKIYQIKQKQTLWLENFVRLDLQNINIIIYMSNAIQIKRVYKEKNCPFKPHNISIKANQDLVIKGLGFIKFTKECQFTLYTDNIEYLIRNSIV